MHKTLRLALGVALLAPLVILSAPDDASAKRKKRKRKTFTVSLEKLGTFETGIFDESAAEITTYDRKRKRLYVVNANDAEPRIDIIDVADPTTPVADGKLVIGDVVPGGSANSVAFHGRYLAVAIQAADKTDPGTIAFFDRKDQLVAQVEVGALPDMVTFSPNGRYVVVANEGEPNDDYDVDPVGSISVIKVPRKLSKLQAKHVRTATFDGVTIPAGVRIFGPGATAQQDLEPEYVAVSRNSRKAWVTLQENNALAIVDLKSATVERVVPLGFVDHSRVEATLTEHPFGADDQPVLGTTTAGQDILLGGFSGLHFEGVDPTTGAWNFITHPDRGPNADTDDVDTDGVKERPFALPDFQAEWTRFSLDPATGEIALGTRTPLFRTDGTTPITGIANLLGQEDGLAYTDEEPVDLNGNDLPLDPFGADFEGIVRAADGTYWMCDEYRPSIYHFAANGNLIARYVPEGSNDFGSVVGTEALPAVFAQRRKNRGFEAIALWEGKVYAFIQSAIDVPDTTNDANSKASSIVRIVEFDIATETTTAVYYYVQEGDGSDKVGDAVAMGPGEFLVLERDSAIGPDSQKAVFRISTRAATDLLGLDESIVGPDGTLELTDPADLVLADILPAHKSLFVDLAALGYDEFDKPEGLTRIDDNTFAVLNDNDFGLAGSIDTTDGTIDLLEDAPPPTLGIFRVEQHGLDASNRDGGINIRTWPTLGMYQPDAIAHYRVGKQDYLITANEGDARDYDGFSEEVRVDDLDLDPTLFPDAITLQDDANLGRLRTTNATGDGGDGTFEEIYSYGTRSFSIWDGDGNLVFDSGEDIERRLAELLPDEFNSTNDENGSFDGRSDDKGPEPEGVIVQKIKRQFFAFIGLERIGGVMVYDVTDPTAPQFVTYVNPRDFSGDAEAGTAGDLGPEGLLFIPRKQSPTKRDLLVVTNEVSGTTTLFEVSTERAE